MKLEMRTTFELTQIYSKVCYAGLEHASQKDINACERISQEKWVSVKSLIPILDNWYMDWKSDYQHFYGENIRLLVKELERKK